MKDLTKVITLPFIDSLCCSCILYVKICMRALAIVEIIRHTMKSLEFQTPLRALLRLLKVFDSMFVSDFFE